MNKTINVKHFANIGDIIASLPSLKTLYQKTKKKIVFCQQLDVPANYYEGAVHPTLDGNNKMVMVNQKMYDMIRPLLLAQEYIADVQVYNGQPINVDLDVIRKERFVNIPHQAIQQWLFLAFPDLATDITKSWIETGDVDISQCYLFDPAFVTEPRPIENLSDKIIVNFTERYRNLILDYFFLKDYQDKIIFAGTELEYLTFTKKWGLQVPRLFVNNFLELAYIIKQAKFLLSNQSFIWNLAEAMKTPRSLELCEYAPNCQAFIGEHSYGYLNQQGARYYFETLIKR